MSAAGTLLVVRDGERLAACAAGLVAAHIRDAVRARGRAMVALAGGSTPERTYALLAKPPLRDQVAWANTYLFFGDERFVPAGDPASNFAMVSRTLLAPLSFPAARVFCVPTGMATAADAADAYEATLAREFATGGRPELPRFDLILLGLGEDGHTASLFPGAASLAAGGRCVVASPPGATPPPVERVTLTLPAINAARAILVLVSGAAKAAALRTVLEGAPGRNRPPAARLDPTAGTLTWLADEAAASLLSRSGQRGPCVTGDAP